MTTFATSESTKKYAARFAGRAAAGHFREQQGLWLSSIGIGTYLGEPDARTDQAYTDAIVAAVEAGVNVIDSAINYRFQRSERSVRAALHELARRGFAREEMVICTKGGFLTPDGDMPADACEGHLSFWSRRSPPRKFTSSEWPRGTRFARARMIRIFFRSPRWSPLRGTSREDRTTSGLCNCHAT